MSNSQSFLPTLDEERSEELRAVASSRQLEDSGRSNLSQSNRSGNSAAIHENSTNIPPLTTTTNNSSGGGGEGIEVPYRSSLSQFDAGGGGGDNTDLHSAELQPEHMPTIREPPRVSSIPRPAALAAPHRSVSVDSGTRNFSRMSMQQQQGLGGLGSKDNATWGDLNNSQGGGGSRPPRTSSLNGPKTLSGRMSLGPGTSAAARAASMRGGFGGSRHSINNGNTTSRPRLSYNPNNNPMQRSHSFRRSLSLVERNDGSSLASNISRKSNNIRNTLANRFSVNKNNPNGGFSIVGGRDSLYQTFANKNKSNANANAAAAAADMMNKKRMQAHIGFNVNDAVLIIHNRDEDDDDNDNDENNPYGYGNSGGGAAYSGNAFVTTVNRCGYPQGMGTTLEEQRGPYIYVLGKVTQVHYEENAKFYTVQREDTGEDVRGDADFMEIIPTKAGEEAARKAATEFAMGAFPNHDLDGDEALGAIPSEGNDKAIRVVENVCVILLLPFIWLYDCFVFIIGARLFHIGSQVYETLRNQAHLFLNGISPYECSTRITTVNLVVLCSVWYNFMDQARLAFFPTSADYALAVINFGIWTVLVVELIFEVFIRPDRYRKLIRSDKAYTPNTVRYISSIHLMVEFVSLAFFVPEFLCLFQSNLTCDGRPIFGFINATFLAVTGLSASKALAGRAIYACIRLRVFGLVRHWKNMWINRTFLKRGRQQNSNILMPSNLNRTSGLNLKSGGVDEATADATFEGTTLTNMQSSEERARLLQKQRDAALINASNIGTALMVTNSYRALTILCAILGLFPMITLINYKGVTNSVAVDMVGQLQGTNLLVTTEDSSNCAFLADSVQSWLDSFHARDKTLITSNKNDFVIALGIQPARCLEDLENISYSNIEFQELPCADIAAVYEFGFVASTSSSSRTEDMCILGSLADARGKSIQEIAQNMGLRVGNLEEETSPSVDQTLVQEDGTSLETHFAIAAQFNKTHPVESSALASFILQLCLLVTVLGGLIILREDAKDLVLGPLRSMLKIVARYAKNPLSQARTTSRDNISVVSDLESEFSSHMDDDENSQDDGFGTYETEQLITAVAKITDLLRKCWGVAGADIISTNLASREGALAEVFNPTVPGKSVYALFAFAAINGFDHALKCLGGDVMILINDVANVLHGEVFRWGFGDSGQCNKNLGSAFLMVFRIGLVKEVVEKLEEATKVVFSTSEAKRVNMKKRNRNTNNNNVATTNLRKDNADGTKLNSWQKVAIARNAATNLRTKHHNRQHDAMTDAMQLSLQSLPGISTFTDRAVIGMLKSFSGIHRDNKLRAWSRDFRLSAGVGTFSVDMIFGMDAGWAVEGAVGSEYKIDATYLSPHVNMASRMMSACKHYGVTILLSEAVQELMSDAACSKLRNLDRVTVKGSTKIQNIYTYDARHKGADFFLFSRSDEQADMEAERYAPSIWNNDQDLKAMRHHVTDDFELEFNAGMKSYYDGDWPNAIKRLENANEIMVEAAMEEGYLHDELDNSPDRKELYRTETSDGPCSYLVHFMKSKKGVPPKGWDGWHPLLSK